MGKEKQKKKLLFCIKMKGTLKQLLIMMEDPKKKCLSNERQK